MSVVQNRDSQLIIITAIDPTHIFFLYITETASRCNRRDPIRSDANLVPVLSLSPITINGIENNNNQNSNDAAESLSRCLLFENLTECCSAVRKSGLRGCYAGQVESRMMVRVGCAQEKEWRQCCASICADDAPSTSPILHRVRLHHDRRQISRLPHWLVTWFFSTSSPEFPMINLPSRSYSIMRKDSVFSRSAGESSIERRTIIGTLCLLIQ